MTKKGHVHFSAYLLTVIFLMLCSFYPVSSPALEPPRIQCDSQQMNVDGQKVLSIGNFKTGLTYTWSKNTSEGVLSSSTGKEATYAAPSTNPDGENNPTIKVCVSDGVETVCSTRSLAVNAYLKHDRVAYRIDESCVNALWADGPDQYFCKGTPHGDIFDLHYPAYNWVCCMNQYCCDGTMYAYSVGRGSCFSSRPNGCSPCCAPLGYCDIGKVQDVRSADLRAQGCLPAVILPDYQQKTAMPEGIDSGKNPADDKKVCSVARQGDPITIFNGNSNQTEEDLRFSSSAREGLIFKRSYNSLSPGSTSIGYGWTHTYNVVLIPTYDFEGTVYLRIIDETGRSVYFIDHGNGFYTGAFKERTTVQVEDGNYVWYRLDGDRYVFNDQEKLIRIEDIVGNRQTLIYDDEGFLQSVNDAASERTLTFHYNADDRLDHITGPVTDAVSDGIWVSYDYDESDNLVSVTYADGSGYEYNYSDTYDLHNLTEKRDMLGHLIASWEYDSEDRAVGNFSRDGRGVSITYIDEHTVEVTDAYGITRTNTIWDIDGRKKVTAIEGPSGCSACGGNIKRLEYDNAGRIIELEYPNGLIIQYDNQDSRGNAGAIKQAVGTAEEKIITATYHPNIDTKLSETRTSILGGGSKVTIWDYDSDGNDSPNENPTRLLYRKIEKGFTKDISRSIQSYEYISAYTYNGKGQVTSIDGPKLGTQDTTTFTYDPTTGDLLSVTRPVIGTTTYSNYDAAGQVGIITDPNGTVMSYTYDGKGRIRTITTQADGGTITLIYNMAGDLSTVTASNGLMFVYTYDNIYGRLIKITDNMGNYVQYSYDDQGNRVEQSHFTSTSEHTFWRRFDYNGPSKPGKLWQIINPDDTVIEYTYDAGGNINTVADANGKTTINNYDVFNRLITVTQPDSVITSYDYDSQDNLTTVTDAGNHTTTYVYDDLGRLISTTSPDSGMTTYTYDEAGKIIAKTNANDITITYSYDSANRLTGIHFPDSLEDITYNYDQGTNGKGLLTGMIDPSGIYAYTYNVKGNIIREDKTIEGVTYTTQYAYDSAGILTGITYPDGRFVTYELDSTGNIQKVTATKDGTTKILAENMSYKPFGPMATLTYGNGTATTRTYDQLYRITNLTAGGHQNRDYTLDPSGNITAITDNLYTNRNQAFTYDDLYRLTGATGIYGSISYTYDKVGNRLSWTENGQTETYAYETGTSRLSSIAGANPKSFTYDATGNTTAINDQTFIYNQNDRLIRVIENDTDLGIYTYNGNGQRVKKTTAETTIIYHYDRFGNLIGESTKDGTFLADYIYLNGTRLAAIPVTLPQEFTVTITTNTGRHLSGVRVYAFTEGGSYTGKYATTDENGIARFELADFTDGVYKFRADYLTSQFWSEIITIPETYSTDIRIQEETTTIMVTQGGAPKAGVRVYLFNGNGSYLGMYETTDANGQVIFALPVEKAFTFRADILGGQFFSETITVVSVGSNDYTIASGGGTLLATVDRGEGTPLENIKIYLFSAQGSYLGLSDRTDDQGQGSFAVPSGSYKLRADYLGCQFWSNEITVSSDQSYTLSIPHQDVSITVVGDCNGTVETRESLKVYLFNEAGSYLGQYRTTDDQGQVTFTLPEKTYKVRADYLGQQYWSPFFSWTDEIVTINEGLAIAIVTNMGLPLEGINVYVFTAAGSYLGLHGVTDDQGTASFKLPAGDYNIRADYMGNHYWSGVTTIIPHVENPMTVSTGGGSFTLTVRKGADDPLTGVNCYLFSGAGAYLSELRITNSLGEAGFNLADGTYKIRIDYLGYQYWTGVFTVPDAMALTHTIPHQDVIMTVAGDYNGDVVPQDTTNVYLFTPSGSYLSQYRTTDENGQVTFNLPQNEYKVRADYLGQQHWSPVFTWADGTITINEGMAQINVMQGETPLENINVYVFTDMGSYLSISGTTNAEGMIAFRLPEGTYKFRADHQGNQYWATQTITAHQSNMVNLDTGGGTFTLSVEKTSGVPLSTVRVYVFTASGSYLGINAQTDDQGHVAFNLSDGDYKFRVDYFGYQFWSAVSAVPATLSDVVTIGHHDVTIAVNRVYGYDTEPLENLRIYLFNAAGSYMGVYANTDDQGQVTFNLPERDYKVRADYLGSQNWSETFNSQDTIIDIIHGKVNLHVTYNGIEVSNAPVYLFTDTGSYLGRYERTDQYGTATFTIPVKSCKLRVDYDGTQYWSPVINVIAHEEMNIGLPLEQLALNLTNDPDPKRYDGSPPKHEQKPIMVASLGSLTGLLTQSIIAQTPQESIYYFINDHLGTPQKMIDENNQVVWEADYKPFGEAAINVNTTVNNFRFPGQYFDSETGLHYNYFRYYDPGIGRYLRPDPIGLAGGDINLYSYVWNNSVSLFDRFGLAGEGQSAFYEEQQYYDELFGKTPTQPAPPPLGHSDFYLSYRFDWTKEDHGWTNPFIPIIGTPRHFMDVYDSIIDVQSAIEDCNLDDFEGAMHRLQDYPFHRKKGYGKVYGHLRDSLLGGKEPDNDPNAWQWSNKMTILYVRKWDKKCGQCDKQ